MLIPLSNRTTPAATLIAVVFLTRQFNGTNALRLVSYRTTTHTTTRTTTVVPIISFAVVPSGARCPTLTICFQSRDPYWDDDDEDFAGTNQRQRQPFLVTTVNRIASILATPTPLLFQNNNGNNAMILAYPLALLFMMWLANTAAPQAVLTSVLFFGLAWLGRTVVGSDGTSIDDDDDDNDNNNPLVEPNDDKSSIRRPSLVLLDLFCFVFSVLSGSLLVPSSHGQSTAAANTMGGFLPQVAVVVVAMVTAAAVLELVAGVQENEKNEDQDDDDARGVEKSMTPQQALMKLWDRDFQKQQLLAKNETSKTDKQSSGDDD